jgi:hypothetical protein
MPRNFLGFGRNEEDDEEAGKAAEAKFNSTVAETVKKVVEETTRADKSTMESLAASIKAMNERFANEDAARQRAEAARKQAENQPKFGTPEEEFERFASDPRGYMNSAAEPATKVALMTAARVTRNEVLSGKPYYHGDFKSKVDSLVESDSNLQNRNNPQYIMNCYKIVLADHMEEINSGKLKQHLGMSGFSDAGNSGRQATDPNAKPTVEYRDAKSKFAASQLGLSDDDIIEAAKSQAIHGLELVA